MLAKTMGTAAMILAGFAVVGTGLVAMTYDGTKQRIADNEREYLLRSLHELVPAETHDNDIFNDTISINSREWMGSKNPVMVYRARKAGEPIAAVIGAVAPDGYNGTIKLLVAIKHDGTLAGVRVVAHKETPGLGDGIEIKRSDWITSFDGKSLNNPIEKLWGVKKDGGSFDQFTGATITPRAIVKAVYKALKYYQTNREALFAPAAKTGNDKHG